MKRFVVILIICIFALSSCVQSGYEDISSIFEESDKVPLSEISESVSQQSDTSKQAKEAVKQVFPKVKEYNEYNYSFVLDKVNVLFENACAEAQDRLKNGLYEKSIGIDENSNVTIVLGNCTTDCPDGESYVIDCGENRIYLSSKGESGQFYAVITFLSLIREKTFYCVKIEDSPTVPKRGIVEGFYGEPWSHEDRLSITAFLGDNKMNTYIYAPKDDIKHREKWREDYNETEKQAFSEIIDCCKSNKVHFVYALSPGLDFKYSSFDAELNKLFLKYNSLYELGVRDFAILLDDLPDRSKENAINHARLVNSLREKLFSEYNDISELITIFAEYFDKAITNDYSSTVAEKLNKDVIVMWTGPDVSLIDIDANSMKIPNAMYNRKTMFWWNYPVNDYTENSLLLDRVDGLKANLTSEISGFVSNPMNQAEASKIPLFTLADFLWNPYGYSSIISYRKAFDYCFGSLGNDARVFSQMVYASYINNHTDSALFSSLISKFKSGDTSVCSEAKQRFHSLISSCESLLDTNLRFVAETRPWIEKAKLYGEMGIILMDIAEKKDSLTNKELWEKCVIFLKKKEACDKIPQYVSHYLLTPLFNSFEGIIDSYRDLTPKTNLIFDLTETITFQEATIKASKSCYGNHSASNALSYSNKEYYWSNGSAGAGFNVTLDLGDVIAVNSVIYQSGVPNAPDDYIRKGEMKYSCDNKTWITLGVFDTKNISLFDLDFKARYIRYESISKQDYWLTLAHFAVNEVVSAKDIHASSAGRSSYEAQNIIGGSIGTSYRATVKNGDTLTINLNNQSVSYIELLASSMPEADVKIVFTDGTSRILNVDGNYLLYESTPKNVEKIIIVFKENGAADICEAVMK